MARIGLSLGIAAWQSSIYDSPEDVFVCVVCCVEVLRGIGGVCGRVSGIAGRLVDSCMEPGVYDAFFGDIMNRWIFVVVLLVGFSMTANTADAQTKTPAKKTAVVAPAKPVAESEKNRDIKKLLDLSGAGALGVQVMAQLAQAYGQMMPNVPQKFWDEFLAEADADSLVRLVIPIYAKHFSHDEIKELIVFYQTPVGKKMVSVQPQIVQESQLVGEKWGAEIGVRIMARLSEKGYQ